MSVLGSAVRVGLYDEVTYKSTTSVTMGMLAYFVENSLTANRNLVDANTISADRSRSIPGAGNIDVTGTIKTEVSPTHVWWWLKHILGAPTTSGASAPYTHTYRPTSLPVGFICEKNWIPAGISSKVEQFLGCRINDATFDFPQEGAVTLSCSVNGAKYTIASTPLDASLNDPGHTGWFAPDVTLKIAGASSLICKSASIKIANNLATDRYCLGTGGERVDMPEGFADCTGSVTAIVDTTLFSGFIDKANSRTDTTLELICSSGTGTGASAGNENLSIKLDHALIQLTSAPISSPNGMEVSFDFKSYKSGGTDKGLLAVLLSPIATATIQA